MEAAELLVHHEREVEEDKHLRYEQEVEEDHLERGEEEEEGLERETKQFKQQSLLFTL